MTIRQAKAIAELEKRNTNENQVVYSDDSCNDFKTCSEYYYTVNGLHNDVNNEMIVLI